MMKSSNANRLQSRRFGLRVALGIFAATAAFAQAAQPQEKRGPQQECRGLGEPSFFRDEGINVKVATKLKFNKALMRETIETKTNGGIVMLYGNVSTPEHARLAAKLASEVGGVRCVTNELVVGPPPPRPSSPY